jgi:tetratricopeptide (TPR) repeat protein
MVKDYDDAYHGLYMDWKEEMLSVFEGRTYNDGIYKQYVELLTKLLCYRNEINSFDRLDSIPVEILVNNYKAPAFIKSNRDQLVRMKKYDEFISIIDLLNNNIQEKGYILSNKGPTSAMMALKMNQHSERLPSFYIISAFNALVKGDMNNFEKGILLAIQTCTDKELIYNLEFWLISMDVEVDEVSDEVLGFLNRGLELELRLPEKAIVEYESALLIQNDYAPSYYLLGRVIYNYKRARHDAETKFEEALRFNPDFISAGIIYIEILKDRRIYNDALNLIDYWLDNSTVLNIWYLNYLKASMLFQESQYYLSKETLIHDCIPLNDNNFNQSILLGDIYIRESNCDSAYIHYKNAGEINSTSKVYNRRMQSYDSMCRRNH